MIDLHTHSRFSDGSDSPSEIVGFAKQANCTCIALTDHDRLDGILEARSQAEALGIDFIAGAEISCVFGDGTFHMLAYFLEPHQGPLQDRLIDMQEARTRRNQEMQTKIKEAGLPITWEELITEAGGPNLGRPHFAAVMVRKGIVGSIQEAFDKYLAKGKPFYIPKVQITPKEAIELTLASGALPVIAHPHTLGIDSSLLGSYLRELKEYGLVGVESYYGKYSPDERVELVDIAETLSLVATGGSDYHGTYKVGLKIGIGEGDLSVPDDVVAKLKDRLA